MKIITEQIKQTIIKEIASKIFKECIKEIEKEISVVRWRPPYSMSEYHVDGLTMAINIIKAIQKKKYSQ